MAGDGSSRESVADVNDDIVDRRGIAARFKKWLKTAAPSHVLIIAVLGSTGA